MQDLALVPAVDHEDRQELQALQAGLAIAHRPGPRRARVPGGEELGGCQVVRVVPDDPADQQPGMGVEHVDDNLAAGGLQVIQAENHLRIAGHETVQFGLVPGQTLSARHLRRRPGHLADGPGGGEAAPDRRTDRLVPERHVRGGGEFPSGQVDVLRPVDLQRQVTGLAVAGEVLAECGTQGLWVGVVDGADALVPRFQPGAQVGREDVVAGRSAAVKRAQMLPGMKVEAWQAERDGHRTSLRRWP